MSHAKFRIAVCGGGIGGLTFAVAMAKYSNVQIDIYEAAQEFFTVGAGVGVWPRVWDVLCKMGLDDLAAKADAPPSDDEVHAFRFRKSDQDKGLQFFNMNTQGRPLSFHRADIQQYLVNKLPSWVGMHHSMRLRSYTRQESGQIDMVFDNGSTATCDILIGADGLKSAVRSSYLGHRAQQAISEGNTERAQALLSSIVPVWSGSIIYKSLIPATMIEDMVPTEALNLPTMYMGKDATLITYPIANRRFYNVSACIQSSKVAGAVFDGPLTAEVKKDEFISVFKDWEPEVQAWLRCIDITPRWATHVVKPFDCFASKGVVLIGDAAHAMLPHLASGAGQAIEDAYFLATLLGHHVTTIETLPRVLSIYDSFRRPFAQDVVQRSELSGRQLALDVEGVDFDNCSTSEKETRLKNLGQAVLENWKFAYTTTLDGQLKEAIEMLEMM